MARDFRKITAWQRGHALTLRICQATSRFPDNERFGLVSQIRRACASIPTNVAEGCGRSSNNELARFIDIATGSASEVEYQLLLAKDLGYLPKDQHTSLSTEVIEIRRMLCSLPSTRRSEIAHRSKLKAHRSTLNAQSSSLKAKSGRNS